MRRPDKTRTRHLIIRSDISTLTMNKINVIRDASAIYSEVTPTSEVKVVRTGRTGYYNYARVRVILWIFPKEFAPLVS